MLGSILAAALVLAARAEDGARPGADSSRLFRRLGEPCDAWCRAATAEPSSTLLPASALERVRAMASRPGALNPTPEPTLAWRVFAAPWCCGSCCYVAACFPCYRTLYDYVDERVRYLAEVAGVAPPAPPPIFVIPGGLVSVPAPLVGGFGAAAAEEAEENTSRSGASSSNARVSSVAYEDDAPLKWNDAWSDALLSAATAAASERTRRR